MKKIIKGKVYDTDTAKRLTSGNYTEGLYRKKTGEFFLHEWGKNIKPITYEQAQKWSEENLDRDEYCAIFGEPDESGEAVMLGLNVSAAAAAKLKNEAAKLGIPQGKLLEQWIMKA